MQLYQFQAPILDKLSAFLIADGAVMAGGYARKLWCIQDDETPASRILPTDDIDFWCPTDEVYVKALETLQMNSFDGHLSPNGARYHWTGTTMNDLMPYNLIRSDVRPFKTIKELLSGFDFTVAQAAIDMSGLWVSGEFLSDITNNKLVLNPELEITDPLETMTRVLKYAAKGFKYDKRVVMDMFNLYGNMNDLHKQFLVNKFNEYLGSSYQ